MMKKRVTKSPDVRKQEILDAAVRLFCEKGYEQTSMLDISKSINVSQGLCYRYFASKEEIYQSVMDYYVSQGIDQFMALLGDKDQNISEVIRNLQPLTDVDSPDNMYHTFFNLNENSQFHMQMELSLLMKLIPIVADRFVRAGQAGEIEVKHPAAAAAYCLFGQFGISAYADKSLTQEQKFEYSKELTKILLEFK